MSNAVRAQSRQKEVHRHQDATRVCFLFFFFLSVVFLLVFWPQLLHENNKKTRDRTKSVSSLCSFFGPGEGPNPEGRKPEGWGPEGMSTGERPKISLWQRRVGQPKISRFFFFPLPPPVSYFLPSLGSLLVELWPRFKAEVRPKCALSFLGSFCVSPGGLVPFFLSFFLFPIFPFLFFFVFVFFSFFCHFFCPFFPSLFCPFLYFLSFFFVPLFVPLFFVFFLSPFFCR